MENVFAKVTFNDTLTISGPGYTAVGQSGTKLSQGFSSESSFKTNIAYLTCAGCPRWVCMKYVVYFQRFSNI